MRLTISRLVGDMSSLPYSATSGSERGFVLVSGASLFMIQREIIHDFPSFFSCYISFHFGQFFLRNRYYLFLHFERKRYNYLHYTVGCINLFKVYFSNCALNLVDFLTEPTLFEFIESYPASLLFKFYITRCLLFTFCHFHFSICVDFCTVLLTCYKHKHSILSL